MKIKVGEWAVVESFMGGLKFFVAEVIYVNDFTIVVKADDHITVERRDMVCLAGTQKRIHALKAEIDTMVEARSKAMKAAEDKVSEIAGQHALAIRKLLKQEKERAL